jgi:hypothetical protein
MADHQIIFSTQMVRALLDGRKTMTRRLLYTRSKHVKTARVLVGHPPPISKLSPDGFPTDIAPDECWALSPWHKVQPGDRLYVRETIERARIDAVGYPSDGTWLPNTLWEWSKDRLPSIHMPRRLSRLTLIVTGTKIERLQEISEADAIAEGCTGKLGPNPDFPDEWDPLPIEEFRDLWISLHGADAWDANPEVVALSFRVVRANIDSVEALAA